MKKENIGLLFYGSVGSGKTYLACSIANSLIEQYRIGVKIRNFSQIINELQKGGFDFDKNAYIESLVNTSVLILDDLGIERDTSYTVYFNYEEYRVREISKNQITGRNDLWLDPSRTGNHQIPIVDVEDNEDLLKQISLERPAFIIGDEVRYKDKDYTITRFDDMGNNLKTVTVKDNTEYLGGMITGSDVIPYRLESDLDRLFENLTYTKHEKTIEGVEVKKTEAHNFKITEETLPEKLSPSERLNNNFEAISMLNRIERGERDLDINAQEVLSKYVGWGGLADIFDESKKGQWEVARNFLKENLTQVEYEAARESTLTAFYTPKTVIDGVYRTLSDMGFKSGNILEPSMGIGNFIGNIPDEMKKLKFYGVELDSVSGRIGKLLYPESDIQIKGFEETSFSNNFFDAVIGNVPFGEYKVNDREYNKNNFLIHDYFFAKSIDKVRNGGVIAFITSSGTMDKKDESVRRYLAARAEFLGAIRLPNDTFKGVAGTEVTSDIIFLKKRDGIQYELNLEDKTWTQYIDDTPIKTESFDYENKGENEALKNMKNEIEMSSFSDLVYVDSEDLRAATGLDIDDEGNFYDPLAKDLDNDGIPDRYDNDFKDSDYFESTYDVEDNLHIKEENTQKSEDKPSILGRIRAYQNESKTEEKQKTKEQEILR